MAIYLTKLINLNDVQILDIKFHKKLDFLAISVIKQGSSGQVLIANNKGDILNDCTITKNVATSAIIWHPCKPLLAIGWVEGQVAVWNEVQNTIEDAAHVHSLPIACLAWSSLGTRLVTADIEGHLNIWKVDNKGALSSVPIVSFDAGCVINCIVLRVPRLQGSDVYDIRELARAAVNGDQRAMDLMSRSSEGLKFTGYAHMDVANFFLGLSDGRVILINEDGKRTEMTLLEGSVISLLYHEERDVLIATTDIGMLTQHQLLQDGNSREVMKVKLACRTPNPSLIWAGPCTLAIALGEPMIRMWDIDREENFTLQPEEHMGYRAAGLLPVVDYCASEKTLVAGSSLGQVVMWKLAAEDAALASDTASPETLWSLQPPTNLSVDSETTSSGAVEKLVASSTNMIAASTSFNAMFLLEERPVISAFTSGIVVTQKAARELYLELFDGDGDDRGDASTNPVSQDLVADEAPRRPARTAGKTSFTVGVTHFIANIEVSRENIAISDGAVVYVYELKFDTDYVMVLCGSFNCPSPILKIHQQNLFIVEKNQLQIRNFQGTVKQLVELSNMDGTVHCVDINNNFMVCSTDKCCLRTYDLSRREPRPMSAVKSLGDCMPSVTAIRSAAVNSTGTVVSLVVEKEKAADPKIYFWDIETDTVQYFNFSTGFGEQDDYSFKSTRAPSSSSRRTRTKSGQRSARQRNRRRQMRDGQGDTAFSVTKSILYNEEDEEEDGEEDALCSDAEKDQEDEPHPTPDGLSSEQLESLTSANEVSNSVPLGHCWDIKDPRLAVVYIKARGGAAGGVRASVDTRAKTADKNQQLNKKLVSLFFTQDDGILMFDNFVFEEEYDRFVGFEAPHYFFTMRSDKVYERKAAGANTGFVCMRIMRDFVGLDTIDRTNKQAMLNFSYYLTIGNMDEAFRAMKLIKSEQVWQNMARMCVKTRRLDVAAVCLGKMNYARAAMELREARHNISEPDAKMAMLALHLNMKDEAIALLRRSERYDLLNELYQAMEEWDRAIEVALTNDRIHLKTTYYNYARYLEEQKRYTEAIDSFVKSGTHAFQVPRMLFDQPEELEKFIRERPEKSLRKWWAQYMECCGEMKTALEFYAAAQDYLSLVRAYWLLGLEKKATEVCNDTGDKAACYHLARQFEAANNIDQAIHYFSRAKAYNSAIRLCKENRRDDHLVNLALLGKAEDQVDAATYLQTRPGYEDKAVMLFHKAGQVSRAVDLAFNTKQFGALQHISGDLSDKTDPDLVQRCAAFFMENHQFDRAVDLLASSKQLWEALKLCVEYNVPMTEELAEKLTPPRAAAEEQQEGPVSVSRVGAPPAEFTESERCRLLEGIGEVALSQGQHHLACKKFTQAANHMMAMKALLKSGDTGKITFFANVAKSREVYLLAANYLQTLDWHRDPEVVKSIIQFYTRGKALDRLAAFYEACAQSEIDEHRDYDKALQALTDSFKYWSKCKFEGDGQRSAKLDQLKDRCTLMKKFIVAVGMVGTSADEGIQQCQMLLDEPHLERGVRYGDVYAVMVKHFIAQSKFKAAYSCLEEMKGRVRNPGAVTAYLDVAALEALHRALGLPYRPPSVPKGQARKPPIDDDDEDDLIDDHVAAAIDDDL